MKKLFLITGLAGLALLPACNSEPDYKAVRADVIKVHDQLMADDEKVTNIKMKLDTLGSAPGLAALKAKQTHLDTAKVHAEIDQLTGKLNIAADSMSHWMENFKTDMDGKSNTEAVAYFSAEKLKVQKLDSVYKALLKESGAYLERFEVKVAESAGGHEHHMH